MSDIYHFFFNYYFVKLILLAKTQTDCMQQIPRFFSIKNLKKMDEIVGKSEKIMGKMEGNPALNCDSSGNRRRPVNFVCSGGAGKWKWKMSSGVEEVEVDAGNGSGTK